MTTQTITPKTDKAIKAVSQKVNRKAATTKAQRTRLKNKAKQEALAWTGGLIIGGIIPIITYHVAHYQAPNPFVSPWGPEMGLWLVVFGGLAYSAPTVAQWFTRYSSRAKSWGFVLSLECAMTFTHSAWTTLPALAVLVGLNAIILANRFKND